MKEFWDERYASDEYIYGKEPNVFFKSWIDRIPPGTLLLPGEGEGRNAVYAASLGWDVLAFDQSEQARIKAMRLADEKGVDIDYRCASMHDIDLHNRSFDMIAVVYFHLHQEIRRGYHAYLASMLKPGGIIVLETFSKEQLGKTSGGPQNIELLYSLKDILLDFEGLEILYAASEQRMLEEGAYHTGLAEIVRFVGKK